MRVVDEKGDGHMQVLLSREHHAVYGFFSFDT